MLQELADLTQEVKFDLQDLPECYILMIDRLNELI